jgi:uncharacterized DUF497 family protein
VATLNPLMIAFDPNKDASNTAKHGVSLQEAVDIEWNDAIHWADTRRDYGELRMCAIAYIGVRLYYIVFVDRADVRRIISLRKANFKEVKRYAES